MSSWGRDTFGEPCRECGYSWSITPADAISLIEGAPARLHGVLAEARGDERHPDLGWSVVGYVAHVADNLRIWTERIVGITDGASTAVAGYDENELARARRYEQISLPAALWTLERSVRDWLDAVDAAPADLVMNHPQRGWLSLQEDVIRTNAHDVAHHEWDIQQTVTEVD